MNLLVDPLPHSLWIAGEEYDINADFRTWIRYEQILTQDTELDEEEIIQGVFSLVFKENVPPKQYREETVEQIMWFHRCGKEERKSSGGSGKAVFCYDYDDGYIAAAFREQYGISLNAAQLHWWEFHAYMLALSDNTEFVKIMGYRAIEIDSKMSSEQKHYYQKMKKQYQLPLKKEIRERNSRLEEALLNGESIDDLL